MTTLIVEERRKAGAFMSKRRGMAEGSSLVWREDKTRCPVKAAWIAISTVSSSRISPTIIMSGFWRRRARKPLAKVMPVLALTCVWFTLGNSYSTGSSMVVIFTDGVFKICKIAYKVVVLP